MHALSASMSRKIPASPRSLTTFVAKCTNESVMEARIMSTGGIDLDRDRADLGVPDAAQRLVRGEPERRVWHAGR